MTNQDFHSCIAACNACADACDYCATACLQETNQQALARCIALDIDCAQICRLAASYMARNSELANYLCKFCEEVCEACGEECARHQMGHCQRAATACRSCAEECRRMAVKMPGAAATSRTQPRPAH